MQLDQLEALRLRLLRRPQLKLIRTETLSIGKTPLLEVSRPSMLRPNKYISRMHQKPTMMHLPHSLSRNISDGRW